MYPPDDHKESNHCWKQSTVGVHPCCSQHSLHRHGSNPALLWDNYAQFSSKNLTPSLRSKLALKSALIELTMGLGNTDKESNCTTTSSPPTNTLESLAEHDDTYMEEEEGDSNAVFEEPEDDGMQHNHPSQYDGIKDDDDSYVSFQAPLVDDPSDDEYNDVDFLGEAVLGFVDGEMNDDEGPKSDDELEDNPRTGVEDDELQMNVSDRAILEILTLCGKSGAPRGFYDDLLMLLRKHIKKGFVMSKVKGRESFLRRMRKKVSTPEPKITKVEGREVVQFSFLEMLRDLLGSGKFNDINNLCVNQDESERFSPFTPTTPEDYPVIMARQWASDTYELLVQDGFDPEKDFFFPIML